MDKLSTLVLALLLSRAFGYSNLDLYEAAKTGDMVTVKLTLGEGLAPTWQKPDYPDKGYTALHAASEYTDNVDLVTLLLDHGAGIDTQDNYGSTPIYLASMYGNEEVVAALAARAADVDLQSNDGWTPLMAAAVDGYVKAATALVAAGAQVGLQDNGGWTALHWAAWSNRTAVARVLLDAGADARVTNKDGRTPVDEARGEGYHALAQMMQEYVPTTSDITTATATAATATPATTTTTTTATTTTPATPTTTIHLTTPAVTSTSTTLVPTVISEDTTTPAATDVETCPDFETPIHSVSTCRGFVHLVHNGGSCKENITWDMGAVCEAVCEDGYGYFNKPINKYTCDQDGVWQPDGRAQECYKIVPVLSAKIQFKIIYDRPSIEDLIYQLDEHVLQYKNDLCFDIEDCEIDHPLQINSVFDDQLKNISEVIITGSISLENITSPIEDFIQNIREQIYIFNTNNHFMALVDYDNEAFVLPMIMDNLKAEPSMNMVLCPHGHAYKHGFCVQCPAGARNCQ